MSDIEPRGCNNAAAIVAALHEYLGAGGDASVSLAGVQCRFEISSPEILSAILADTVKDDGAAQNSWLSTFFAQAAARVERAGEASEELGRAARFRSWQRQQRRLGFATERP